MNTKLKDFLKKIPYLKRAILCLIKIRDLLQSLINPLMISQYSLKRVMLKQKNMVSGLVLDIGSGNNPYQSLYQISEYISLDIVRNENIDIQGDGMKLPLKADAIDTILSNEVLEHVPRPSDFMSEAFRVLKPGGVLILTTPQTWGLHHEPHDYYRYTKYGLHYLSESVGFEVVKIYATTGFLATFIQRMVDTLLHHYFIMYPKIFKKMICIVCAPIVWLGVLLSYSARKYGDTLDNVLVAKKPLRSEI